MKISTAFMIVYDLLFFSDMLRTIKDPEKPSTLEDLNVVYEEGIFIQKPTGNNVAVVCIHSDV